MEIVGTVISKDGKMATVVVKRTSACGENCANCKGVCTPTTAKAVAENLALADVGDTVKIESNSIDVIRVAFFLYILPVLVAIIGAVFTYSIKMNDIFVILVSVICFFLSFIIIKRFEKRLAPKSYITKILAKGVK